MVANIVILTLTTALLLAPTTQAAIFPWHPKAASSPVRKWQRGAAKVAPHYQHQRRQQTSITSSSTAEQVVTRICDENDAKDCYARLLPEVQKSAREYCSAQAQGLVKCQARYSPVERVAAGECRERREGVEGCEAFTYEMYAYCLTYGYSGVTRIVECVNVELEGELTPTLPAAKRMAVAVVAQAPYALVNVSAGNRNSQRSSTSTSAFVAPLPASIAYYTNGSIAWQPASMFTLATSRVAPSTTRFTNITSPTSTPAITSTLAVGFGGAGRNGTYSASGGGPVMSANMSLSISYSLPSPPASLTSLGAVSSLQAGTLPTVMPVAKSSAPYMASFAGGNRVGVFTTAGSVCTRYTKVVTAG